MQARLASAKARVSTANAILRGAIAVRAFVVATAGIRVGLGVRAHACVAPLARDAAARLVGWRVVARIAGAGAQYGRCAARASSAACAPSPCAAAATGSAAALAVATDAVGSEVTTEGVFAWIADAAAVNVGLANVERGVEAARGHAEALIALIAILRAGMCVRALGALPSAIAP